MSDLIIRRRIIPSPERLEKRIAKREAVIASLAALVEADKTVLMDLRMRALMPLRHPLSRAPIYLPRDLDLVAEGKTIVYTYCYRDVARLAPLPRATGRRCVIPPGTTRWSLDQIPRRPFPIAARLAKGEPVVVTYRKEPMALLVPPSWEAL